MAEYIIPVISVNMSDGGKSGNSRMNLIQTTEENVWNLTAWFCTVEGSHYILMYEAPPPSMMAAWGDYAEN